MLISKVEFSEGFAILHTAKQISYEFLSLLPVLQFSFYLLPFHIDGISFFLSGGP